MRGDNAEWLYANYFWLLLLKGGRNSRGKTLKIKVLKTELKEKTTKNILFDYFSNE